MNRVVAIGLRHLSPLMLLALAPVSGHGQQSSVDWSPEMAAVWSDSDRWALITPDDVRAPFERLLGLRVVYHRQERLLSTPLTERAVYQFESSNWKGRPAITAWFHTGGDLYDPATGAGWWTGVLDPTSMRLLNSSSSSIRFGYFMTHTTETGSVSWRKSRDAAEDWSEGTRNEHEPAFLANLWSYILVGLDLEEGMEFQLPMLMGGSSTPTPHRVAGRVTIEDMNGVRHDAWAVQTPEGGSGVREMYIDTEAPYFFGYDAKNFATGVVSRRMRLESFQRLRE